MNRTKIEYCDFTWNVVTGCENNCPYCYARDITIRFPQNYPNGFDPTWYPRRLYEPTRVHKPSIILVCSMGDLFGPWVPAEWIDKILEVVEMCPQHTFLFLTKYPSQLKRFVFPDNCWAGTTIDGSSLPRARLAGLLRARATIHFVSFEPLLAPLFNLDLTGLDWVIIGAQTGKRKPFIKPDPAWVQDLINKGDQLGIPIFLKPNLKWPIVRQEMPR